MPGACVAQRMAWLAEPFLCLGGAWSLPTGDCLLETAYLRFSQIRLWISTCGSPCSSGRQRSHHAR